MSSNGSSPPPSRGRRHDPWHLAGVPPSGGPLLIAVRNSNPWLESVSSAFIRGSNSCLHSSDSFDSWFTSLVPTPLGCIPRHALCDPRARQPLPRPSHLGIHPLRSPH